MLFSEYLAEGRKKENKIVFVETDPHSPYPKDTMTSLHKEINKNCKDLTQDWKSAIEVINNSFNNLDIPIPRAYQKERWKQYYELIGYAVKNLVDARGFKGNWSTTI